MNKKSIFLAAIPVALSLPMMPTASHADAATPGVSPRDNWGLTALGPNIPKPEPKAAPIKHELKTNFESLAATGEPLSLATDGKANAVLVLAQKPNSSAQQAAELLQRVFAEISGVKLAIVPEDKLQTKQVGGKQTFIADGQTYQNLISIGDTQAATAAKINANDLKADGYRLQTRDSILFVVGHDVAPRMGADGKPLEISKTGPNDYVAANGTRNGAYALLERHFGCRWLWPSEAGGEILPKQRNLRLQPLNESDQPAITQRILRNYYPDNGKNSSGRRQQQSVLPILGRSYSSLLSKAKNSGDWFKAMGLGQSIEIKVGHGYGDYWERYGQSHPEFFALQADGTRNQARLENSSSRAKLDVSNPELVETIAQNVIAQFDADPSLTTASISPNDGSYPSFCLCEVCRRLDPPQGDPVSFTIMDKEGKTSSVTYPSLSDRYTIFYSKIAEKVAKKYPGRLLGAYAYSTYSSPPLYAKLAPNIFASYVGLSYFNDAQRNKDLQSWDGWAQSAQQLQLRPNALLGAYGIPAVFAHKMGRDIKHTYQTGMIGANFDSLTHDWAGRGLNYYVLAKLLWDPSQDVDGLIKDYCDQGFGSASPTIQKYFATLEKVTDEVAKNAADSSRDEDAINPNSIRGVLSLVAKSYTPQKLAELEGILADAKKQAANDPAVQQRIDFLGQSLRYAHAETNWLRAYFSPNSPDKKQRVLKSLDERKAVFTDLYDNHFYAQSIFMPLYRESSLFKEYDWPTK